MEQCSEAGCCSLHWDLAPKAMQTLSLHFVNFVQRAKRIQNKDTCSVYLFSLRQGNEGLEKERKRRCLLAMRAYFCAMQASVPC